MMTKQPGKAKVFFRRFFAVNLLISILPLLLLSGLAQSVFRLYRTSAAEEERQRVQRVVSQIDATLNNTINTCRHYVLNSDALEDILYWSKDKALFSTEYIDLLRNAYVTLTTTFAYPEEASLKDYRIIQPANQNEVMLSSTNASSGLETLYYTFQNQPMDYALWRSFVFSKSDFPTLLMDSSRQLCVFFYQPDKRCSAPYDGFTLMLCFHPTQLLDSQLKSSSALILADASNRPLFRQTARGQECYTADDVCSYLTDGYVGVLEDEKSYVVGCTSQLYGYRLYSVHAYADLFAQPLRVERAFYCVLLAVLAACICLSYYSARRHSEPLVPFIALAAPRERANYQDTLGSIYSSVVLQQERTQKMLSRHSTMTRHMLLERLFETPYMENAQMEQILSMCNVDLSSPAFAVLVIRIAHSARDSLAGYVYDLCVNLFASRGYIYLSREKDVAVLFHGECFSPEACQALAGETDRSLSELLQASYRICIGPAVGSKERIFHSYACAREALSRAPENASRIVCFDEASQQAFTYTSKMQSALSQQLKAGKSADVFRLLDEIWAANASLTASSSASLLLLVSNLMGTICQVLSEMQQPELTANVSAQMAELSRCLIGMQPRAMMDAIYSLCADLCEAVKQAQSSVTKTLAQAIEAYIQAAYASPDTSLETAAQALGVSAPQINHACREVYHSSFIKMLEVFRLQTAAKCIERGESTLVTIGEQVGYLSYTSFSRAFKRVYGLSPSEYRKQLPLNENVLS